MEIKNNYLDLIKVFSIILISIYMISQVGYDLNASHRLGYVLVRLVSNLGFPLLLMVFGASVLNKTENSFKTVTNCYKHLIPPFIFWNIILGALIIYFNGTHSFVTNLTSANWFMWIILSNVLVIPILVEFFRWEKDNGVKYILGLFILTSIIWSLSCQFDFGMYYIDLVFFAEPLMFMVLGYYLNNSEFNLSGNKLLTIFAAALIVRIFLVSSSVNDWNSFFIFLFKNTTLQISVDPFTIIEVSALFLIFKSLEVELLSHSNVINLYSKMSYHYLLMIPIFAIILLNLSFNISWIYLTVVGTAILLIICGTIFSIKKIIKI